jgi:AraC-like DNA-binding protein
MAEVVRVAALTGFIPAMEALGIDPAPFLREAGLSPKLLSNPEQVISARAAMRLLEHSAEVTGCITLGLRMAEGRELSDLGAPSLLIAHQATLRDALAALRQYRNRLNSTLILHIEDIGDGVLIREEFSLSEPEPSRQSSDLALGVLARMCFSVLGETWCPQLVCIAHQPPPPSELPIYRRLFRCRAEFDSEFNGIVLNHADLDRPNHRADRALAEHARRLLESTMSVERHSLAQQVEQSILLLLPSGRATIQTCADLLGLTVRTLQRGLDAEATSFSALMHKSRVQLSSRYLANPRSRITDVAALLGYSSIGAFTRWHGQTFGLSPRASRNVARTVQS